MSASPRSAAALSLACLFVWSCSRESPPVETPVSGASLFAVNCAICHGGEGKGDGVAAASMKPAPPKLDSALLASRKKDDLEAAIRKGVRRDGRQTMPPAGDISDADIKALVEYLYELAKGSEGRK